MVEVSQGDSSGRGGGPIPPLPPPTRVSHPFHMYDMIRSIPKSFGEVLKQVEGFGNMPIRGRVYFTGSGTSYYAAWMGSQTLYGRAAYRAVESNEFVWYEPVTPDSLTVGVSHSGITKSTVDALAKAKKGGGVTLGITHYADSPISKVSDYTLVVGDGPDLSRCHTKTYVDSAAAVLALAFRFLGGGEAEGFFTGRLPELMGDVIVRCDVDAAKAAREFVDVKKVFVVSSGYNLVTAREGALKIKESSYIASEGIGLEEFLHGPWVALDRESLALFIAPSDAAIDRYRVALRAAEMVGAHTLAVSDTQLDAHRLFHVPSIPTILTPFITILPIYLFAYYLSVERGNNPDYLRYLEPAYWSARNIIFPPGTH
ncbi:MAG: SIS domain-containing protein [Thermoprotei archaeon]